VCERSGRTILGQRDQLCYDRWALRYWARVDSTWSGIRRCDPSGIVSSWPVASRTQPVDWRRVRSHPQIRNSNVYHTLSAAAPARTTLRARVHDSRAIMQYSCCDIERSARCLTSAARSQSTLHAACVEARTLTALQRNTYSDHSGRRTVPFVVTRAYMFRCLKERVTLPTMRLPGIVQSRSRDARIRYTGALML